MFNFHQLTAVVGLLLVISFAGSISSNTASYRQTTLAANLIKPISNRQNHSLLNRNPFISDDLSTCTALFVRGGSSDLSIEDDEEDSSFVVTKLRNIVRGLLKIGDKNIPIFSSVLRTGLKMVESITGIRLLPKKKKAPKKESKKSKQKSGKKSKKKKQETEDSEKETEEGEEASTNDDEDKVSETKKKKAAKKPKTKPSATTTKHATETLKSNNPNYRIQRELKEFLASPPPNLSVQVGTNIRIWIVTMVGAKNTIYEGEVFKLRIQFPKEYPVVPPSVYFLQGHIPTHEHVYTNGDICLSLLGKDWRPTMTAQSIAVSILSILSSAQSKSLPMDNARHAGNKPGQYQKDWVYHE